MKFGGENIENSTAKKPESKPFKERFSRAIRKKILVSAALIASSLVGGHVGYKKFYEGTDYTQSGAFNEAFKKAREDKKKIFRWQGQKFNTDLADSELSANYWESKKFLEDYYSSDYFKSKQKPKGYDLSGIKSEVLDKAFIRWEQLFDRRRVLTKQEKEELKQCSDIISKNTQVETTKEFQNKMREWQNERARERISALKEPTYFSITHQKGNRNSDGSYNTKTKDVFIYGKKGGHDDTTAVHELGHKSIKGNIMLLHNNTYDEMYNKAFASAKDNQAFFIKYGQKGFEYLSDPTEIDARQNSVRFWLFKHFPGYTANTTFTEEHYNFLKKSYKDLPYDIQQLMDLFWYSKDFISNMNTY